MNSEFTIAVHCLIVLARIPGHMSSSEALSRKVHAHPARVRKIMSVLRRNELVMTKEGLGGGYRLNCEPCKVTLALVYRTIACEALKLNWSSGDDKNDPAFRSVQTVMNHTFQNAEMVLEKYLEQLTIASLLEQTEQSMKQMLLSQAES
ncbi:transcriptional regulator [Sporolactobacillus sp. THM7-4]|nr:transcriptional regulator [Sporolactobacillus sp. THM7-4]